MTSRTQPSVQYEDITPKSEWKEEKEANILSIYLPDFIKEQLKITYVNSTRTIRVVGETQIAGNKWRRFNQSFPVPENCEVNKIQAKFINGVLIITLPKTIMEQAAPPELDSKPTTTQEAPTPQKPAPTIPEIKEQKGLEEITGKVGTSREQVGERVETRTLPEIRKDSKPLKGMEEVTGKVGTSQEKDGKKVRKAPTLQQILEESKPEKDQIDQAPLRDERVDVKERREAIEQAPREAKVGGKDKSFAEQKEEVSKKRAKSLIVPPETDRERNIKKREETTMVGEGKSVVKSKKSAMELVAGKVKGVKDAVRGLAMELSEDRKKMVSIGVAVIVIAAVGAYLYYRYRPYGTTDQE